MKQKIGIVGLCVAIIASSGLVLAQGSAAREAALILRILSYDSTLEARARGGQVTILVAYKRGDSDSERVRSEIARAVNAIGRKTTVAGMRARAVDHAYSDPGSLLSAARSSGAVAVYVAPGLERDVSGIRGAARSGNLLTLTPNEGSVRAGLSVGLISQGSRVRLLVNLSAVRAEGARLDAAVLRLAEVIR